MVVVADNPADLYLDLLRNCLTRSLFEHADEPIRLDGSGLRAKVIRQFASLLAKRDVRLMRRVELDIAARITGSDWPPDAETMIGHHRLDQLRDAVRTVVAEGIPGDLVECGVWRGGASIFMRGALEAFGDDSRAVWLADSFEGLPPPDGENYPADRGDLHHTWHNLAVSRHEVEANFRRFGLLDDRVRFLPGWFRDTLPGAPFSSLAILRLDGDMYESTIQALDALYHKVAEGGFVIADDYGATPGCHAAVDEFRARHHIAEPLHQIDWTGFYWRKRSGLS